MSEEDLNLCLEVCVIMAEAFGHLEVTKVKTTDLRENLVSE